MGINIDSSIEFIINEINTLQKSVTMSKKNTMT